MTGRPVEPAMTPAEQQQLAALRGTVEERRRALRDAEDDLERYEWALFRKRAAERVPMRIEPAELVRALRTAELRLVDVADLLSLGECGQLVGEIALLSNAIDRAVVRAQSSPRRAQTPVTPEAPTFHPFAEQVLGVIGEQLGSDAADGVRERVKIALAR